jgi:hypothetical protein
MNKLGSYYHDTAIDFAKDPSLTATPFRSIGVYTFANKCLFDPGLSTEGQIKKFKQL